MLVGTTYLNFILFTRIVDRIVEQYHATKFPLYLSFTVDDYFNRYILAVSPNFLSIRIVLSCIYLLIFYFEKFLIWICIREAFKTLQHLPCKIEEIKKKLIWIKGNRNNMIFERRLSSTEV